jgi:aminoglycoside phosphotransferase (APT) family kinase protein
MQLSAQLARIHRVDLPLPDAAFLPPPAGDLPELPANAHPAFEAQRVHAALKAAWPVAQRNKSTLLHGDYWPGNILWHDGQLAAVIDWEDAAFGDPLVDFAIARLDLLWIFGREALEGFSQQYRLLSAVDIASLPYWDLYAVLRLARLAGANLAAWAAFFQPYGRADITEETIREHVQFFISQAFEKIG